MPTLRRPDRPDRPDPLPRVVIHPLDDAPERKLIPADVGRMRMSRTVKLALVALRVYLILIVLLVVYRVIILATGGH